MHDIADEDVSLNSCQFNGTPYPFQLRADPGRKNLKIMDKYIIRGVAFKLTKGVHCF